MTYTPAKHQPLYDELTAFFKTLDTPVSVLACVSGGADSVALAHLLYDCRKTLGIDRLAVAHVNHGLRGEESDGDEAFVKNIAERLGIDIYSTKLDGASAYNNDNGIEDWARNERYKFFQEVKTGNGFTHVATAHTANDQAETLIMRLSRGTGVRGLRGILPRREDGIIRPLIGVERCRLEKWLGDRGLTYRTDSSNADTAFRRNFVRAEIIPLLTEFNSLAVSNIAACAASASRVWEIARQQIEAWVGDYVIRVNSDTIFHIEKAGLLSDGLIAAEALVILFDEYGIPPSRLHIDRVMSSLHLTSGKFLLPNGWKFYPTEDRICFVRG